jgi:hypothetical protein
LNFFTDTPLNGVKYLDFVYFVKAYDLYYNRSSSTITPDLVEEILRLKNGMNKQRTNFNRSTKIKITDYWLLGLIEGEGSFPLNKIEISTKFRYKNGFGSRASFYCN